VPNFIDAPTGASICEVRAEILSSPCKTAIGSGIIFAEATVGVASPRTASTAALKILIYDRD
jgi:hypothetical protein